MSTTRVDDEVYQARRLDVVRIFARHLKALDPATEIPPGDVLSRRQGRVPPYLYAPQEVAALMNATADLAPTMRAATWRTLIGLLAVTGMRQGEACRLGRGDVDLQTGPLVIADSKFGKSRQVFLDPTAATALGTARRWEPKTLRLRTLGIAGRLARGGPRLRLAPGRPRALGPRLHHSDQPAASRRPRLAGHTCNCDQEGEPRPPGATPRPPDTVTTERVI